MPKDIPYLSELFRIVEGALRHDDDKVKNYSLLLADKLEALGETTTASRLRHLIEKQGHHLRPAFVDQHGALPVDSESRFPLLQREAVPADVTRFVFTEQQRNLVEDYLSVVKSREKLETKGINTSTNLLLYGPPGCGKSHLAHHIARELKLPLFLARLDGLISSFLGSTAKNIRAVLEYASRTPCVLLLDEFDAIAKLRDDHQELGELKRVVNSFLQNLDVLGKEVVLIAATNHEQLLDPAVWRRFRYQLKVGLPELEQREELWRMFGEDIGWQPKEIKALADLSEGFSGAAIEAVCIRLRERAIIKDTPPTLRAALIELFSQNGGGPERSPVIPPDMMDDPIKLSDYLQSRNPQIYNMSIIGEIAGRSRVTMSRLGSQKKREKRGGRRSGKSHAR